MRNHDNTWVKKIECETIDLDKAALRVDHEVNVKDVDKDGHKDDANAGASSSASFDT